MSPIAERAAAWLLAYAIHSTLLLGAAALVTLRLRDHAWRDTLWRAALVGGVLTVGAQAVLGHNPAAGGWTPASAVHASAEPARGVAADALPAAVNAAAPAAQGSASAPATARGTQSSAAAPVSAAAVAWPSADWRSTLLAAWALGALLLLARLGVRQASLHRMLGARTPVVDPELGGVLAALCRAAGVARVPRLTESARCPTPLALGMGEICVPERFRELPAEERRAALAHELAHVARRDPLWYLAAGIAEAVFFFQPLHRLARRRLRESAEYLSDDWAVRQTGSPLGLARCLVEVAGWLKGADPVPPGVLAMAEGGSVLSRRIERLVAQLHPAAPVRPAWRVAAALLLLAPVAALAPGAVPATAAAASPRPSAPRLPSLATLPGRQEGRIVRHPDPSRPLVERVAWAMAQAHGRRAWFGWAMPAVPNRGGATMHDTRGMDFADLRRTPVTRVLGAREGEAVVLFHVDASGRTDRITTRLGSVGLDFGGAPVYWLGSATGAESLAWLEARAGRERDEAMRRGLVEAIGTHGESARVLPLLFARISDDPSVEVRAVAAEALGRHPGDATLRRLVELTGDADSRMRLEATETLGQLEMEGARRELRRLIRESPDADVRREAVETLTEAGTSAAELEALAFGGDLPVEREATETLQGLRPLDALPALERIAWRHPKLEVRRQAAETLGHLQGGTGRAALDSIIARHPDPEVREEARDQLRNR
ncbi:MAG: HEAT repeat domain-containing protein [Longimicrobiaceae bacterium]